MKKIKKNMSNIKLLQKGIILLLMVIFFSSCATYYLTPQSLAEQMVNAEPEKKTTILVAFPIMIPFTVKGNSLRTIQVTDRNGNEKTLKVTNHTGIRITQKNGKRTTFYLNTLILKDSLITGKKDHFMGIDIKPININNVEKIEIQK